MHQNMTVLFALDALAEAAQGKQAALFPAGLKVRPGMRSVILSLARQHVPMMLCAQEHPPEQAEAFLRDTALTPSFTRIISRVEDAGAVSSAPAGPAAMLVRLGRKDETPEVCALAGDGALPAEGIACPSPAALLACLAPGIPAARGLFLSVEGLDGCGKTTQIRHLHSFLDGLGFQVTATREPGGPPISEKIRALLLDPENGEMTSMTEALLYAAARSQHVSQVILPALQAGSLVLCDRFLDSSIAFQGGGRQLGADTVNRINFFAVQGIAPDITVLLQLNHETALARRLNASQPDRIEREKASFHARVEQTYNALYQGQPERFLRVDAAAPEDQVFAHIRELLLERLLRLEG